MKLIYFFLIFILCNYSIVFSLELFKDELFKEVEDDFLNEKDPIIINKKVILNEVIECNNNVDIKSLSINQKNIEYILNNIEERLERLERLEKLLTFY